MDILNVYSQGNIIIMNMNNIKAKNSIRKGKWNHVSVHYESDWTTLYVNGESFYEGETIPNEIWLSLLELMSGATTETTFDDDAK